MSGYIEKKDWETAKMQFENLVVNACLNIECYKATVEMINKKLAEFPVEDKSADPMPDAIKDIAKEMTK